MCLVLFFLRYCPRSLVGSLLFPLLLSFSFAGLQFPLRDLLSRAILSRLSFTGFGFFETSLLFEMLRIIIEQSFVMFLLIFLLVCVLFCSFNFFLAFLIGGPFPRLLVLMMVFLILISRCTLVSLLLCCARNAVSVALGFHRWVRSVRMRLCFVLCVK